MKISTKTFIYFFISVCIILLGVFLFSRYWLTDYHLHEAMRYEKQISAVASLKSEEFILHNEILDLFNFLNSIEKNDPYIEYIYVKQGDDILVHTFGKGFPSDFSKLSSLPENMNSLIIPVEDNNGNIFYHLQTAIQNPPATTLNLIISKNKILQALNPYRNLMFFVSIICVVIFPPGLAFFLSRLVSKPLNRLRSGVDRIGAGDLSYRFEIRGEKEISTLIKDINLMAENLERMKEEMEDEINERILTENEMEQQTILLNNILNNVPHKIFWKNKNSVYLGCNRAFAEAAGFLNPDEIIGKTDKDLPWTLGEAYKFQEADRDIVNNGREQLDVEEIITESDGNIKNIITSKVPLKDNSGTVYGILGIYYDITERRRIEEKLKHTQKMEAIGTLAGGIAHDFNNILSGILGYTELAMDENDSNTIKEFLKETIKFGIRAKELVKQILTFGRKNSEELKPIQLSEMIEEEMRLLKSTLPSTIEINADIQDKHGFILASQTQIQQILLNLCTNAAQAMNDGGKIDISLRAIEISAEAAKKYGSIIPGKYLELRIADTGPGIDPAIIHRIFEPFFTTKENGKGTGLGLALVHSIVGEYHGDVNVNSVSGKGTVFTIILPEVESMSHEKSDTVSVIPTGNERILFVDDERMLAELGEKIVTSLGYSVKSINSSLEALEIVKKSPNSFDLIITDQTMPHMTGYILSKEILSVNPDARIILCTGYSDNLNPEKVKNAGIKALLYKPLSKMDLAMTIRKVLEN